MDTEEEHSEYLRTRVEEIEYRAYLLVNDELETDAKLSKEDQILLVEEIVGVQLARILTAKILAGGVAASEAAIERITSFARGVAAHAVGERLRGDSR